jgi:hypothetical protein
MNWQEEIMVEKDSRYNQVYNIIRRSQTLILNIKLLGADTTHAKELLTTAKDALESGDYETAIDYAKKSMVEVMELKKQIKTDGKARPPAKSKKASAPATTAASEAEGTVETKKGKDSDKTKKSPEAPAETEPELEPEPEADDTKEPSDKPLKLGVAKNFENGFSYLIEENRPNYCFNIFSELLSTNEDGLCICRTNPAIIRRKYEFSEDITMLWLTDRESSKESTISPSLESMIYVAEEFIDKNNKAVILLDGIEYLISNNGFNPVLRFIRRLIDKISETSSILLIGVGSKAMNEQELNLLERELNPVVY